MRTLGDVTLKEFLDYCEKNDCFDCPYKKICGNIIITKDLRKILEEKMDEDEE